MKNYYYTDKLGNLKKFVFCTRGCSETYKQEDVGISIFKAEKLYLCYKCIRDLGLDQKIFLQEKVCDYEKIISEQNEDDFETRNNITHDVVEDDIEEETIENDIEEETTKNNINEILETKKKNKSDTIKTKNIINNIEEQTNFYAIVIKCKDNTYYCGTTSNIEKSIKYHNNGSMSAYTKPKFRRPVTLVEYKNASSLEESKNIKEKFKLIYKCQEN